LSDAAGLIGPSVRRVEDRRLLTGRGCYVADVPLESALHVAVVRSPHAHARVIRIDLDAARATRGVVGAFTLGDLPELRGALPPPVVPAAPIKPYRQSALADGIVRFAGKPVAVVVATDGECASDGAAAATIDYEPLAAAVDCEAAMAADAPLVHPAWGASGRRPRARRRPRQASARLRRGERRSPAVHPRRGPPPPRTSPRSRTTQRSRRRCPSPRR